MSVILIVEDDAALAEALADVLDVAGHQVSTVADGGAALQVLERQRFDLVLSDVHMEGMDGHALLKAIKTRWPTPVLLMTAYGSIPKAVEAMREGAADYLVKPFEAEALNGIVLRHLTPLADEGGPVAVDPKSRDLLALAERVAATDATVLLLGESGTGKEVLARYIHRHSRRAARPFVAINCAAIPDNMLEATLFGYEKGAFTGAWRATPGKFEQAEGGTLLLDEISEMDLALQAKLLRVLQEREVERLGGRGVIALDVRVLATSNRDMRAEVAAGRFREDLYYRLNVFPLMLPPLRDRPADILPLAERALLRAAQAAGRAVPGLTEEAQQQLLHHGWPGNVRELENLMQRATILALGDGVEAGHLLFEGEPLLPSAPLVLETPAPALPRQLRDREEQMILEAVREGSRKAAAEKLGISQRTLRYKLARMREAGITVPD